MPRFSISVLTRCCGLISLLLSSTPAGAQEYPVNFQPVTIDADAGKVVYAVITADVDNDKDADIVALTENRVIWYEQPTWKPHVILKDQTPPDNVCIAAHDIDSDGLVDFAIGAGWTKTGTLHWIHRTPDPKALWSVAAVGEETSVHRIRWADVLGKGKPQLVVSPLNASTGNGVRLMAWEIPDSPAIQRWTSTVLNGDLNRMHNHLHLDFDGNGTIDTIAASREGLSLIRRNQTDWEKVPLSEGRTGESDPNLNGAGEVRSGRLKNGRRFLTSVEPMHGDQLAVYTELRTPNTPWQRTIIHQGFKRGHALWTADFDGDGTDEIAFGHSDTPEKFGVIVWWCTDDLGTTWIPQVIDAGGIATEDLTVADLTGDGRPDIVAGGRATHNVKLYTNIVGKQ